MGQNWKKLFSRVNWQNRPSAATALGATNLNKSDYALDEIDNRVIQLDTLKADMAVVNEMVANVTIDSETGIITVTKKDGSSQTYDTKLEKIAVNFEYDADNKRLVITLDDGTKQYVDMSALIKEYSFNDSDTIAFTEVSGAVSAIVKDGSITESKLQPNYLANIKSEVAKAESASASASESASSVGNIAKTSQSYAVGGTGTRPNEDTDNAKYYYEKTKDAIGNSVTVTDIGNPLTLETSKGRIIDFKAEGYTEVADEKIKSLGDLGLVDLGDLSWGKLSDGIFGAPLTSAKASYDNNLVVSNNYLVVRSWSDMSNTDKSIAKSDDNNLYIHDNNYTDANEFKNAMQGVYLAYETDKGFANKYGLPIVSESPNLFDFDKFVTGMTVTRGSLDVLGNRLKLTSNANDCYTNLYNTFNIPVKPGEKYILSWETDATADNNALLYVFFMLNGTVKSNSHVYAPIKNKEITIPDGVDSIAFRFGVAQANKTISYWDIHVEKGDTPTEYQPYAKSTSIIPLAEPLFDGDVIYKYADGTGKIVKKMTQVDLGSLNWSYNSAEDAKIFYSTGLVGKTNGADFVCSIYTNSGYVTYVNMADMSAQLRTNSIVVKNLSYTNASLFKTAMSGIKLVYEMPETQEIPLTADQILAFEKVKTFEGITILSMPFDASMEVTAFANGKDGEVVSALKNQKGVIYSTEEIVVGEWFGKTLYQKTIVATATSGKNAYTALDLNIDSNENDVVFVDYNHTYILDTTPSTATKLVATLTPYNDTNANRWWQGGIRLIDSTWSFYYKINFDRFLSKQMYITVQYTKGASSNSARMNSIPMSQSVLKDDEETFEKTVVEDEVTKLDM